MRTNPRLNVNSVNSGVFDYILVIVKVIAHLRNIKLTGAFFGISGMKSDRIDTSR